MRISNGLIALTFDPRTGSLIGVEDLRSGVQHLKDRGAGRLFRLFVPDEESWIGQYCDSHEATAPPELDSHAEKLTMRFRNLLSPHGKPLGIEATVTVELPEGADEVRFTIRVKNRGPFIVHEVWFPWVGGWTGYAGPGKDRVTLPYVFLDPYRIRRPSDLTLLGQHRRSYYGLTSTLPLLDISGGGVGLSYIHYPSRPSLSGVVLEDLSLTVDKSQPSWSWVHFPHLGEGGRWTSDPVGLAPHRGDWHATADRFRSWLSTWWRAPRTTPRLRGSIGLQNVQFRDFEGNELRPLSDLPRIALHSLEHGVEDFCLWDVIMNVYLRPGKGGPLEDTPDRLNELRRVLSEVKRMGLKVSTLLNVRLITEKNRLWPEMGEKWSVRTLYGALQLQTYPCRARTAKYQSSYLDEGGHPLCQSHPEFQRWAQEKVEQAVQMGFNSLFIDQPFGDHHCFAADHGHSVPADDEEGAYQWLAQATRTLRERDPGIYFIGEAGNIWNTQLMDVWWNWGWSQHVPELVRYVLPDSIQCWVIDACEHEHLVNRAFALGFLLALNVRGLEGTLEDVPDFAERVKRLAVLRRATRAFTVDGRFRDRQGVAVDGERSTDVGLYETGDAVGVVLGDGSRQGRGGTVRLSIEPGALGVRGLRPRATLFDRSARTKDLKVAEKSGKLEVELRLGRRDVAVIKFDKIPGGM